MPLGKDSIQKRVAKPAATPEAPAKKAPAKKAPAKKATPAVKTTVLTGVAPETVKKVTGNDSFVKISLGEDMPHYLL